MYDNQTDQNGVKLTLFIYMDGLCQVLTRRRSLVTADSVSFGAIHSQEKEVQSELHNFYASSGLERFEIGSVDLIFVNSIFHKIKDGHLEAYKNRLPAFLFYHKEYFNVPVNHNHIAQCLSSHLLEWVSIHKKSVLWFHLRKNILFVLFSTARQEFSISSFEVHKTLDIHYYILFNFQTLHRSLTDLDQITISGEFLEMDDIHKFFSQNIPGIELVTFWQWKGLLGRPQPKLSAYLPEVSI